MRIYFLLMFLFNYAVVSAQAIIMYDFQRLTVNDTEKLLAHQEFLVHKDLSQKYGVEVIKLSDGRIVILYGSHSFIHPNETSAINYYNHTEEKYEENPVTYSGDLIGNSEDFIRNVDSLKSRFLKETEFVFLDTSGKISLQILDHHINTCSSPNQLEHWIPEMVAVTGEFIREKVNGQWGTKSDDYIIGKSIPCIIDKKGRVYNPLYIVQKEIKENLPETGESAIYDHTIIELKSVNSDIDIKDLE